MEQTNKLRVRLNPNADTEALMQAVRDNQGYCPCAIWRTNDTKCMCKEFREQTVPGECHCGLYAKEFVDA